MVETTPSSELGIRYPAVTTRLVDGVALSSSAFSQMASFLPPDMSTVWSPSNAVNLTNESK